MAIADYKAEQYLLKVFEDKWHLARINTSKFDTAKDELHEVQAMAKWAQETIGPMYGVMSSPWFDPEFGSWYGIKLSRHLELDFHCQYILAFKNADDYLMFTLQWPTHLKT